MTDERFTELIAHAGLVPVHADSDPVAAVEALTACYAGGIRFFEFTDRMPGALEVFHGIKRVADAELPGMVIGAGTITKVERAAAFVDAGAEFLVSPVLAPQVLAWSRERGVPFVPGAASPTEVWRALEDGANVVKLFPAGPLGPAYLKSLLGPLPCKVMVTGGVSATPEAIRTWLGTGAVAVGLGSDLVPRGRLLPEQLVDLTRKCEALTTAVAALRGPAA
ncbi:MAG: hypothetical protein KIT12_02730 [Trueperaceae bacterium]|nr:hypothetical protein [Trueperaceae bacterium]